MTFLELALAMTVGGAMVSAAAVVVNRRSKKRKEEAQEYWRRRQREQDEEKERKEKEEQRWKELEAKYGAGREEVAYQVSDSLRTWRECDGVQRPAPGHVGFIGLVKRYTGQDASKEPYTVTEVRFKWVEEVERIEDKENANLFTAGASGAGKSSQARLL